MKILKLTFLLTIILASTLLSAEEIDFASRKYKVVHSSVTFGTFGHILQGYILEFNPRKLMASKPRNLYFTTTEGTQVPAYLGLAEGNFQLMKTDKNEYAKFKCYSFMSQDDLEKIRFDVISDKRMIITYESSGIIHGVVALDIVRVESEQGGSGQPATAPGSKSGDNDKPQPESKPAPR